MAELNAAFGTVSDGGGTRTFTTPEDTNDEDVATHARRASFATGSPQTSILTTDLGNQYEIQTVQVIGGTGAVPTNTDAVHWTVETSSDGADWDAAPASSVLDDTGPRGITTLTLNTPTNARHVRIIHTSGTGFVSNLWVSTWDINGDPVDTTIDPEPPPYVSPEPGRAIIEIYVTDPDGWRWDEALWDEALWSADEWVSISEYVLFADVTWGASRPDAGILADQVAGQWVVQTYDPDRVLDPGNPDSPFYPLLVPDLPIRLNHGSARTVRTGQVVDVSYSHAEGGGRISASDAVSRASRAAVPPGTDLADTFYQRSADAIEAAGIRLHVGFPSGELMDAALAPVDEDARKSVWQRISDAARELLAVAWVDRDGSLRITEWDADTDRGLVVDSSVMIDLTSWVSHDGLYSVVRALDADGVTIAESRVTPLPAYGERVYERTEPTIDSADWTQRVLADRVAAVLRYRPGTIRPETAADNNALVDMELMDIITLSYPEADPPIEVRARVLGARVRVTDRTKSLPTVLTRWEWTLLTTVVPTEPLIADPGTPLEYLVSDDTYPVYLYPG